jgi:hypothetical protein
MSRAATYQFLLDKFHRVEFYLLSSVTSTFFLFKLIIKPFLIAMLFSTSCSKDDLNVPSKEVNPNPIEQSTIVIEKDGFSLTAYATSGIDDENTKQELATWLLTTSGDFKMSIAVSGKNLITTAPIKIYSNWDEKESIQLNIKNEVYSTRNMTIDKKEMGEIRILNFNRDYIEGEVNCSLMSPRGTVFELKNMKFSSKIVHYNNYIQH